MQVPKLDLTAAGAPRSWWCAGQAMIEYLVVTITVTLVLFIPNELTNNMSAAEYLARAVRSFFRSYSFLVSVS